MKLTSETVEAIFMDCLFQEGEDTSDPAIAEGIVSKFGFHRGRLASHSERIGELLAELPEQFQADKGGGWSFLNACMTKDDEQWGEHRNIEQLLCLGIASERARIQFPRSMWSILPGGMPYFSVNTPPAQAHATSGAAMPDAPAEPCEETGALATP